MFKAIIPYYITQILYQQHKYDDLIAYAPVCMDSVTEKENLRNYWGDAYYKKTAYPEAIKYYKVLKSIVEQIERVIIK